jgi:hypothetical protein
MSFLCRLSRKHYWCTPHRSADNRLVQVCYECGAERPASDLYNEVAAERFNKSLARARAEMVRLSEDSAGDRPITRREAVAVGQGRARKFSIIK